MFNLFSDEVRRNPYPMYEQLRSTSPVLHLPPPIDIWMVFDFEGVKRVLNDHETLSSAVPAPKDWFLFLDPPRHSKLRALISRAFTPRAIADLEPSIRQLSRELIDRAMERNPMDLAANYSVPLPMKVIARMIGIPGSEWSRFRHWSDQILKLSYTMRGMATVATN